MWKPTAHGFPWDHCVGWPLTLGLFALPRRRHRSRALQWSRRRLQELAA